MDESIRMTEDQDKWRKYVHSVANPRIEDGQLGPRKGEPTNSDDVTEPRHYSDLILYDHYLPTVILIVILIIIGIPSPTHSFTLGLNPSFSANPPYPSLSFFSFRFHYMDFPDCLLLLLSISIFLLFSFSVFTYF